MPLQIRRGTDIQRQAITPAAGELIFVTNTNQLYVGNGSTPGGILATGYTNNDAQDAAAVIFTANNPAHSGINFTYNTSTNLITAAVNLSNYAGVIRADAFKGSLFADDGSTVGGTELVNAVDGSINLDGTVKGHIVPDVALAYDLGSAAFRFRDLYLSGSSIELGAATITATGSAVNLPAGSTVGGEIIGTGGGNNDYRGNIIGDDSSIIVNTANNSIVAISGIFGNVSGIVTGQAGSTLVGNVNGIVFGDVYGSVLSDDSSVTFVNTDEFTVSNGTLTLDFNIIKTDAAAIILASEDNPVEEIIANADILVIRKAGIDDTLDNMVTCTLDGARQSGGNIADVQNGDFVGVFSINGYQGNDYVQKILLVGAIDAATIDNPLPGKILFGLHDAAGNFAAEVSINSRHHLAAPVMRFTPFADVTARNTALPAAVVAAGMVIYLQSTNKLQVNTDSTTTGWIDLH